MLSVELTCNSGHTVKWDSQPEVKRKPLGNLLLSAAFVFTGNTFTAISQLASCFNLKFFSESVFYGTQKSTCSLLFTRHGKLKLGSKLRFLLPVVLNLDGDGRCDNPGHSAKYGTYTLMDEDIGNVVTFQVVQVTKGPF